MAIAGTAVGAGLSAATSIWGGIESRRAHQRAQRRLREERNRNAAWYRRRYNEDYADTAAGRALISRAMDYARDTWKKASASSKVLGSSDAHAAQLKSAAGEAVGKTIQNLGSMDTQRKQNVENQYRNRDAQIANLQYQDNQLHAQQIADAAANASNAMINTGLAVDGYTGAKNKKKASDSFLDSLINPDTEYYE